MFCDFFSHNMRSPRTSTNPEVFLPENKKYGRVNWGYVAMQINWTNENKTLAYLFLFLKYLLFILVSWHILHPRGSPHYGSIGMKSTRTPIQTKLQRGAKKRLKPATQSDGLCVLKWSNRPKVVSTLPTYSSEADETSIIWYHGI